MHVIPHGQDPEFKPNAGILKWTAQAGTEWDPSHVVDKTFICHRLGLWELLKYEQGFLYYQVFDLEPK